MAVVKLSCNNTVVNGTLHLVINLIQPNGGTNSTSAQDSMGAMRFTIAVVLVYGVGVIGLLGISARRNRRLELMDKEVNKFIKSKLSKYEERRAKKPKRTIYKLISSLHSIIQNDDPEGRFNPKPKSQVILGPGSSLCRANTWAGDAADAKPTGKNKLTCESVTLEADVIKTSPSGTACENPSCRSNHSPVHAVLMNSPTASGTIHSKASCHSNRSPGDASGLLRGNPPPALQKIHEEHDTACDEDNKVLGACLKFHESTKKVVSFKDIDTHDVSMNSTIIYV
ncbi:unnamed protein product [Lymnaea stagnalis]|uniref:Uncharacterized protein n=1 Tax=Lymnaea stagnalis TaxID=6523 RepID=A0AAV2IKE0_LYMST